MSPDERPPLELPSQTRARLGQDALEWVLEYLERAAVSPLYPPVGADALRAALDEPLPRVAQDPGVVLQQFAQLAALGRNNGHPRMFGYVQSSGNFAATIGDFLASALNQNVTSWRSAPSATAIELQVIEWLGEFIGVPHRAGLLLGGGSAANMTALAAALRASTDVDINARGVAALPAPARIYASNRVHMSIPKAAALLGLGRNAVRLVETTPDGAMDVVSLRDAMNEDHVAGLHQVCVVASAGEVNAGAIDRLNEIADVCASAGVWLHVDGAYGAFAASVPRMSPAFGGIERADSIALDPHKWLFAPLDAGCLLVRDPDSLRRTFTQGAAYIDVVADRDMSEFAFWDVSPELSRRFRALKLWFAFKCHGTAAFVSTIDRNIALAQTLARLIDEADDFERLAPVPLSIVCFRYAPARLRGDEEALNALNRRLMVQVQRAGSSYVSNAMFGRTFALRACIVNHRTTETDLHQLLADIRHSAQHP